MREMSEGGVKEREENIVKRAKQRRIFPEANKKKKVRWRGKGYGAVAAKNREGRRG